MNVATKVKDESVMLSIEGGLKEEKISCMEDCVVHRCRSRFMRHIIQPVSVRPIQK